ncbi:mannitol dehydrogenase family protein [Methylobrevis albus]|uniref:Mannitol dehydrogenase family protein n=1 Tax=Methylobrevis albus TaxID=2793297 RepID=A0A931I1S5_9HYPH|nr:mannitol dehydrogenase family protein [Methylobrevis albus]MBH0237693.1 mannitol dehydrogenase family protein [Methylobrevis albus]
MSPAAPDTDPAAAPVRLSAATLPGLPAGVARPTYDRAGVTPGIVHLGIGAFHRAHQAVAIDDLLAADPAWGIIGASLRSADTAAALGPQDGLYALAVRQDETTDLRVIGSILGVLVAPEDPERLLAALTDPRVRIVTLTVTEKGYCHDPATGRLDEAHPDVVADLVPGAVPRSAIGYLVEALARRRDAGTPPFAVVPCDNLPSNGATVRRIVTRFAELRDPGLGAWVAAEVAFPSTMVDRIVPATTDADRALVQSRLGVADAWPVMTEPFSQWVIEDNFPGGRPRFEDAGATMVADVAPFERMKLRMLNGSHSTLAYLGYLAGHETVADVMADASFAGFIAALMTDEIMPTLTVPGADLPAYRDALIARFRNRGLKHRTWQIAMDGSQKLPQRLLGTIADRRAAGLPFDRLALGVAAWMRYAAGTDETGAAIDVRDPLRPRFAEVAAEAGGDPARLAAGFLGLAEVFGALGSDAVFRSTVTAALNDLVAEGAAARVAQLSARQG